MSIALELSEMMLFNTVLVVLRIGELKYEPLPELMINRWNDRHPLSNYKSLSTKNKP